MKNSKLKQNLNSLWRYFILTAVALLMLYPIIWLVGASFKTNNEIFSSINFIPSSIDFSVYLKAWETGGQYTFGTYMINSIQIVLPKIIFTIISSTLVAYGFARFDFPFKKPLFSLLISTLFLPQVVTRIPLYLLWKQFGLLNTYVPLVINTVFAQEAFFVFMLVQFMRSIPRDFDEAATIDGCNSFQILTMILAPMLKPAIVTVGLFQFLWSYNDFLGPLIYISSVEKYPVAIAVKMAMDASAGVTPWNQIIATSLIGLLPSIVLFFCASKQFVDGMSAGGLKG